VRGHAGQAPTTKDETHAKGQAAQDTPASIAGANTQQRVQRKQAGGQRVAALRTQAR